MRKYCPEMNRRDFGKLKDMNLCVKLAYNAIYDCDCGYSFGMLIYFEQICSSNICESYHLYFVYEMGKNFPFLLKFGSYELSFTTHKGSIHFQSHILPRILCVYAILTTYLPESRTHLLLHYPERERVTQYCCLRCNKWVAEWIWLK